MRDIVCGGSERSRPFPTDGEKAAIKFKVVYREKRACGPMAGIGPYKWGKVPRHTGYVSPRRDGGIAPYKQF